MVLQSNWTAISQVAWALPKKRGPPKDGYLATGILFIIGSIKLAAEVSQDIANRKCSSRNLVIRRLSDAAKCLVSLVDCLVARVARLCAGCGGACGGIRISNPERSNSLPPTAPR
jgi:hypothetical protein